jgi:hypothetical protein
VLSNARYAGPNPVFGCTTIGSGFEISRSDPDTRPHPNLLLICGRDGPGSLCEPASFTSCSS